MVHFRATEVPVLESEEEQRYDGDPSVAAADRDLGAQMNLATGKASVGRAASYEPTQDSSEANYFSGFL